MSDQQKRKNWFAKHKILTVVLILVVLAVIGAASGGSKNNSSNSSSPKTTANSPNASTTKQYRFAERADKQGTDIEVLPNETGTLNGVKMTVTKVDYTTNLGAYETADSGKTYLVADVTLENTSNKTQSYNSLDFRIQTAGGQVLDSTYGTVPNPLNSADLVAGGKATGQVVFQVPVETAHQYIIWKPSFASDRVIIQAK